jgi:fibronectin type 3 domain-containing protein
LWAGREVFCRVRLAHKKGRWSDWSDFAILHVVPPLAIPQNLRAESASEGVVLSWEDPDSRGGKTYRIYRKQDSQPAPAVAATSAEPRWVDRTVAFGRTYEYAVEAVLVTGNSEARSERTAPVVITPLDRFPPEVPSGLVAVAGPASIELSWDPDRDPDVAGYFVWRAAEGGPFERISGLLGAPSFSDARVERGKRYRYAVSAADRLGNESARSEPVEASLP